MLDSSPCERERERGRGFQRVPESWNMGLGGFVLGSLILYLKGMRRMMFQLLASTVRSYDLRNKGKPSLEPDVSPLPGMVRIC